jgi:hypothetical protein
MSHAEKADKLLIKPAAGARPPPPYTRRQITRRVTRGTATTRLATTPDRPTRRVVSGLRWPRRRWKMPTTDEVETVSHADPPAANRRHSLGPDRMECLAPRS